MKNIVIIFGMNSLEHEISLKSAYVIGKEIYDSKLYNIIFVGILKDGSWKYDNSIDSIILNPFDVTKIKINENCNNVFQIGNGMINNTLIDKVFLATHGKMGEDGNIQGFLKVNNIPYTGNDVDGSVVCFNKNICKYVAELHGIKVVPYLCLNNYDFDPSNPNILDRVKCLGDNLVVKINKGGSSIGVFFCNQANLYETLEKAFELDDLVIIEKEVIVREFSVGVLFKDNQIMVSEIGEHEKNVNQLSFEEKYLNNNDVIIPDNLDSELQKLIIEQSIILFKRLNLKSYARIDFFLDQENNLYFNEINNLPGFSKKSLFYSVWKNKFSYFELVNYILNI